MKHIDNAAQSEKDRFHGTAVAILRFLETTYLFERQFGRNQRAELCDNLRVQAMKLSMLFDLLAENTVLGKELKEAGIQ